MSIYKHTFIIFSLYNHVEGGYETCFINILFVFTKMSSLRILTGPGCYENFISGKKMSRDIYFQKFKIPKTSQTWLIDKDEDN